jgi:hypothetical protein
VQGKVQASVGSTVGSPARLAGGKSALPGALSPVHVLQHCNNISGGGSPTPASRPLYNGRSEHGSSGSSGSRLPDYEQQLSQYQMAPQLPQVLVAQHSQWQPASVHAGLVKSAAGSPAPAGGSSLPPAGQAAAAGAAAVMPQYMLASRAPVSVRESSAVESPSRHRKTTSAPASQWHTLALQHAAQQHLQQQQQSGTGSAGSSSGVAAGSAQPQHSQHSVSSLAERVINNPTYGKLDLVVCSVDAGPVLGTSCDTPDSNCSSHSVVSAAPGQGGSSNRGVGGSHCCWAWPSHWFMPHLGNATMPHVPLDWRQLVSPLQWRTAHYGAVRYGVTFVNMSWVQSAPRVPCVCSTLFASRCFVQQMCCTCCLC